MDLSTFSVDPELTPRIAKLPAFDDIKTREVASIADKAGRAADFVANEFLVATTDAKALAELLTRWSGRNVLSLKLDGGESAPAVEYHVVEIDSSSIDASNIASDLQALDQSSRNDFTLSSEVALRTLASCIAAAREDASPDCVVGLNWIMYPSEEAPTGDALGGVLPYTPNLYDWPYLASGTVQDFSVLGAWDRLREAGRTAAPVRIAIFDAGFSVSRDLPRTTTVVPAGGNNVPNPFPTSRGGSAPWHGTNVASACAAVPYDGFGTAGPAGVLSNLSLFLVQSPSLDLGSIIRYLGSVVPTSLRAGPRIISMSFEVPVPASLFALAEPFNLFTTTLVASGIGVFASAGNQGEDVDGQDCAGVCWERTWYVPAENRGVVGVGGLGVDSLNVANGSNFGSALDADTVDIFGPMDVWVGPDPGATSNSAQARSGTSFSAPFIAGVAALVLAADPQLRPSEVVAILRDTANVGGPDPRVRRWVNANRAVMRALAWTEESGWRWCNRCQGLWLNLGPYRGVCAAGGVHDRQRSWNYSVILNSPTYPGQSGWRRCVRCLGLWFSGGPSVGVCPAGGEHWQVLSADYRVAMDLVDPPGQAGWVWCRRCQGLWFGGQSAGMCPDGGGHDRGGSGIYSLITVGRQTSN